MPLVKLFVKEDGQYNHFYNVDEALARRHLEVVRESLNRIPPNAENKGVYLDRAPSQELIFVLNRVVGFRDTTNIKIQGRTLPVAIAIYQAIQALGVWPKQPKVEGHINWYVANNDLTVEGIQAVHIAFGSLGRASRSWAAMVDRLAWCFAEGKYTDDQKSAINKEVEKHPELQAAIAEKIDELKARKEFNEADARERVLTGRTWQRKFHPEAPLKVHATPRQSNEGDEELIAQTFNALKLKSERNQAIQSEAESSKAESVESWMDLELIAADHKDGTILGSISYQMLSTEGVTSVRVEVAIDQEKMRADKLKEHSAGWIQGVLETFDSG